MSDNEVKKEAAKEVETAAEKPEVKKEAKPKAKSKSKSGIIVNCNVRHDGTFYNEGDTISKDDPNFKTLEGLGFLTT